MTHAESLEIVTHAYDPPGQHQYSKLLKIQFASLYRHRPAYPTMLTVCYTVTDISVSSTVRWITDFYKREGTLDNLSVQTFDLPPEMLFRRAIGRNIAALRTKADLVWFTDVDYYFGPGAVAAACEQLRPDCLLATPKEVQIHRDHETGAMDIFEQANAEIPVVVPGHFVPRKIKVAIGGVQIVGGRFASQYGYLRGTKWVECVDPKNGFLSCKCDRAFRRWLKHEVAVKTGAAMLPTQKITCPTVYRWRHTMDGRDYDQRGVVRGKEVWTA